MPPLTPASTRPSGYNGAALPPRTGGGGGGGRSSGGNRPDFIPNYGDRLRRARKGLAIALAPVLVLFISYTSAYLIHWGFVGMDVSDAAYRKAWVPVQLPWALLLANTAILIVSSLTVDRARRGITRQAALAPVQSIPGVSLGDERHFPWLPLTTILGILFLAGQLLLWSQLSSQGFHFAGGTSSSFIYMLTAMHGLHLAAGILALFIAAAAAILRRPLETRRIIIDITSWYWHAMTGLWIYILILFSFAAQ